MSVSLYAYLENLEQETYELMVGTGDSNALSYGFTKKRPGQMFFLLAVVLLAL